MSPASALRGLAPEAWLRFLAGRRWFPAGVRVVRPVGAAPVGSSAALGLLAVDAPRPWTAQVLLAVRGARVGEAGTIVQAQRDGVRELPGGLVEAGEAAGAFAALAPALRAGGSFEGEGARWTATPVGAGWQGAGDAVRLASGEQSNTAAVFGETAMFKLFRRVEAGAHPELELGRYLTERGFCHCPPLLAEVEVETDEGRAAAGVLHAFLPGRVDGWAYAVSHGPKDMSLEARALGATTRALHEVLAAADGESLAPREVGEGERARWAEGLRATAEAALGRLAARLPSLRPPARALAGAVAARSEELVVAAEERLRAAAGVQIRVHGDYHLGQVLFDPSQGAWSILDFEGEPSRPLAERALRQLPLRDVAGMLRSFGYAATVGGGGEAWERTVCAAFLAGYDEVGAPTSTLPPARESPLLRACVVERAFYELAYELDYRPDNAWIPLSALAGMAR